MVLILPSLLARVAQVSIDSKPMVEHSCILFRELFKVHYAVSVSLFNELEVFQPVFGPHPSLTSSQTFQSRLKPNNAA